MILIVVFVGAVAVLFLFVVMMLDVDFAELRQGFERATRLVQQLLTLARHEPGASPTVREPVDLLAVARNVVSDLSSIASVKHLDLGLESESNGDAQAFLCNGDGESLRKSASWSLR